MTAPPLTLRNLTSIPLELRVIERFEAPGRLQKDPEHKTSGLFRNVTNFAGFGGSNSTAPSSSALAEGAQSFAREEVSVHVEPFRSAHTDLKTSERNSDEILRLLINFDGEDHRIDVPGQTNGSTVFSPLSAQPRFNFTGIYHSSDSHLAVYSSSDLHCWMRNFRDRTPLSALSIPGTHNSPTHHKALPSVRCQAVSPRAQLLNGIRFFDVRVQPEGDATNPALILVHGAFPISLTGPKYLRRLLDDVYVFLAENPSETVIISLKREGTGSASDQDLARILHDFYVAGADENKWHVDPSVPSLGQTRGKVVLLRRFCVPDEYHGFHDGRGWGLDAESWADNTAFDRHGNICIQDFYEVLETENIEKKLGFAREHCKQAGAQVAPLPGVNTDAANPVPGGPFYINFLSASNFWKKGCWPEKIAEKLNPGMVRWLCCDHCREENAEGDAGTGIVVMDWVGADGGRSTAF
ncbi:MAG: hypothetical protein Q9162_003631 [Coniocarpon cinnabarinum]